MTEYKDKWCQEAYNKGFEEGREFEKGQIEKAKEIIKKLLVRLNRFTYTGLDCEECKQAEQFLKDSDIDNAIQQANEGLDFDKIADEMEQDLKDSEVEK